MHQMAPQRVALAKGRGRSHRLAARGGRRMMTHAPDTARPRRSPDTTASSLVSCCSYMLQCQARRFPLSCRI